MCSKSYFFRKCQAHSHVSGFIDYEVIFLVKYTFLFSKIIKKNKADRQATIAGASILHTLCPLLFRGTWGVPRHIGTLANDILRLVPTAIGICTPLLPGKHRPRSLSAFVPIGHIKLDQKAFVKQDTRGGSLTLAPQECNTYPVRACPV